MMMVMMMMMMFGCHEGIRLARNLVPVIAKVLYQTAGGRGAII